MRILILLIGFLFSGLLHAEDITISCDGSPKEAVLNVPKPADQFLHVFCTRFGHAMEPNKGWFWSPPGRYKPVFFPAQMVRREPKFSGNTIYFKSITAVPLSGKIAQKKWSVLAKEFPKAKPPTQALKIDTVNNDGEPHRIYIFPNALGYSCNPKCSKDNAFMMVNEEDKKPQW
jgi:hypothetical protein